MPKKEYRKQRFSGNIHLFILTTILVTMLWIVLLSVTLMSTLRFSLSTLQSQIEEVLTSTSTSLAESGMIRQSLLQGYCSDEVIEYLDLLVKATNTLDIITIADADSVRVYHVVHERIGQSFVGDDQDRALAGESYISDATGTMGPQHRSMSPVFSEGQVIGFVMASTTMDQLDVLRKEIISLYVRLTVALVFVTLAICAFITFFIRWMLHGYQPDELVHGYLTQNELLNNLDEGFISVDSKGAVQLLNRAAEEMLGQQADMLIGLPLDSLILEKMGGSLLAGPRKDVPTSRANILASSIPLVDGERRKGTTLILTDRTEAMRVAEQLIGTRHVVSALRANTHEFLNKLQAISGLLMMGRTDDALDYIGAIADTHAKAAAPILRYIQNPNVAALLLGKLSNMRELEIELTILGNSRLPKHSQYLSTNDLITVVGNLLENAIEAVKVQSGDESSIVLQITEDETGLLISVSDTGCGIPADILERIYEPGFSTKAQEGRGMGMFLIKDLTDRRGGSIEVESEPGVGTTFTLIFSQKQERRHTA